MVTRAKIVTVLIGLVAVVNVLLAASVWIYAGDPALYFGELDGLGALITFAANIMFLWWMHTARNNVDHLGPHRRGRVWVLWGWALPVVNLWFPKQVMDDTWRATDPHGSRRLVSEWWAAWLGMMFFELATLVWAEYRQGDMVGFAWLWTGYAIFTIVAAVLATKVVRKVTDMQVAMNLVAA